MMGWLIIMNNPQIRSNSHSQKLQKYHESSNTIVVDELSFKHGKNWADIAVMNEDKANTEGITK